MQESIGGPPATSVPAGPFGRALRRLSLVMAIGGGVLLFAMIALSVYSVAGRWLANAPVQGDFELVQLGCAVSVSAMLPWCQMEKGNVIVDFFTMRASVRTLAWLDAFGALLLAGCAALVAWRLTLGTINVRATQETTMILAVPVWWAYAPMVPAFALLAVTACHSAWQHLAGIRVR